MQLEVIYHSRDFSFFNHGNSPFVFYGSPGLVLLHSTPVCYCFLIILQAVDLETPNVSPAFSQVRLIFLFLFRGVINICAF